MYKTIRPTSGSVRIRTFS